MDASTLSPDSTLTAYEALVRHAPTPLLLLSTDGRILAASAAAVGLLGARRLDSGGFLQELIRPGSDFSDYLRMCARTLSPLPGRISVMVGDQERILLCKGSRLPGDQPSVLLHLWERPQTDAFLLLNQKIAELNNEIHYRRESEEALRRSNEELEQFAYVASHDLQEPLRNIALYTQLALKRLPQNDPLLVKHAERIRENVQRMQDQISDLLSYSRAVHHQDDTSAPVAELDRALAVALETIKERVQHSRAVVVSDPLPAVRGDEAQLCLVFQNLLLNSIKYQPEGSTPQVRIQAHAQDSRWVVSVSDNGIGFSPEYAEKIFGLFKRLHTSRFAGTGLGLAICRRVVERYHGRIWAESAGEGAGGGATFYFSLPRAPAPDG